jgi:hypothetical protein
MEEFGVSRPIGIKMSQTEKDELKAQEDRAIAAEEAEAAIAETQLTDADKALPQRTTSTGSWVEAMSE